MKRLIVSIFVFVYCLSSFALTESEGIMYVKKYYGLINEYAVTPDNITLAKKIEGMHVGKGYVYPDVEINLGKLTETKSVGIKTEYLASIMSRQSLLLKFVPQNISLEGNYNGICTMAYTLYVYSGNEKPGQNVFKYSVPLRIEIQNSDKKIRSILKGMKTPQQYTLGISTSSLSFGASGGTRTITVNSNTNWEISVNTASWGHLTRSGNTLTLRVDANTSSSSRTDYFKIKAGDKEEKITISQVAPTTPKPTAQITNTTILQNQTLAEGKGMSIKISFNIYNMKDKKGHVAAYFYDDEGVSIKDQNGEYKDAGNPASVSTGKDFTPPYINSEYTDFVLNIPYSELHQTGSYSRTLKFKIIIWDMSAASAKEICRSTSYTSFLYTPVEEIYLTIDGNTSDKTKYFSESGGREIYYINTNASSYETWGVPSWCSIENKTSSSFTLVCSPNTSSEERNDWMKVKAGGKEIRIDIKQEGKRSATTIHNTWITHNLTRSMWNGYMWVNVSYMRIHCHFDVEGHKGENIRVCAYFYFANGNRVNAVNPEFRTSDGQATVQGNGHCDYEGTEWKDYCLDIPYYALPKGNLTVQIQIQDKNGGFLANSSHYSFTLY